MFDGCDALLGIRREDPERFMVEVAHHIYGEKYVQQANIEEETV